MVALLGFGTMQAQERSVRAAQVPQAVRDAFRRAFPNAVIRGWSTEQDSGRTMFEVESRQGAMTRDVLLTADGTLTEVEESVPFAELPAAVRTALTVQARGARVTRSERVIHVAAADTLYEFAVRGRRDEIKLKKDGTAP